MCENDLAPRVAGFNLARVHDSMASGRFAKGWLTPPHASVGSYDGKLLAEIETRNVWYILQGDFCKTTFSSWLCALQYASFSLGNTLACLRIFFLFMLASMIAGRA